MNDSPPPPTGRRLVSKASLKHRKHLQEICRGLRGAWESKNIMLQTALLNTIPDLIAACQRFVREGSIEADAQSENSASVVQKSSVNTARSVDRIGPHALLCRAVA